MSKSKLNTPRFRQANPRDRDALEQMIIAYYIFDNQTVEKSKIKSSGATKEQGTEIRVKPAKAIFGEDIA